MIRLFLVFVVFTILIHFSITSWQALSGKQRWSLTKIAGYSIIVSLLAVLAMASIVIIF